MEYGMLSLLITIQVAQCEKLHKQDEEVAGIPQLKYGHTLIVHLQKVQDSLQKNTTSYSHLKILQVDEVDSLHKLYKQAYQMLRRQLWIELMKLNQQTYLESKQNLMRQILILILQSERLLIQ